MMSETDVLNPSDVQEIDAEASVLMKQGIRLLEDARPDGAAAALVCFDRALAMRRRLPIDTSPDLRYGLAACWLNRAEALMRIRDESHAALALEAHDEAILLLSDLPRFGDPRFPRRLAIAHQNRGLVLLHQGNVGEATTAFGQAISLLEHNQSASIPDRAFLLAAALMNLASVWAARPSEEDDVLARDASLRAIALIADLETNEADGAEVGLKARHILCQIAARRLSAEPGDTVLRDDVDEATDAVDDGLTLVREWERKGITRFRGVACDLFRFGARVYAAFQPQFLNEFILDNADPARSSAGYVASDEMRSAVAEALSLVVPVSEPEES
jgi:tetratricopeptide (TPR) repeat protein